MSLDRIGKKLRRELTGNPKKAVVLGLLVMVALYFWSPLIWGWIAPERPTNESVADSTGDGVRSPLWPAETPRSSTAPDDRQTDVFPWTQLVAWMKQDPRTSAAAEIAGQRDPFQPVMKDEVKKQEEEKAEEQPPPVETVRTPQSLGMKLSGTIVSPRGKVALLDGQTYREGQQIGRAEDGKQYVFTLAEVHAERIVLERLGMRYDLMIPKATGSGRIELLGSN